ncbi:hypothetical protein RIF29_26264 [Crotalaria pallida]|uniref:MIF4G domain-containing protein n=1 Tax=Crotalaria pallida TaxID=3830 RepID=A0AAN9ESH9_CROPI
MGKQVEEMEDDKCSFEYQKATWETLRKSITGLMNKVTATNITNIIPELFSKNLIRGRGLFVRHCLKSQMASPRFSDVFAALVAALNTKFPQVGHLLLRRVVFLIRRAYYLNDKKQLSGIVTFLAHLVNQRVAHATIALELLADLLEKTTYDDSSVEVAFEFVGECGSLLQDRNPKGLHGIFVRFLEILHEGKIDKRVQFMIEGLFAMRKAKFRGYPAVRPELDLVEEKDQITHEIYLDEEFDLEIYLDVFNPDPNFAESEKHYEELKKAMRDSRMSSVLNAVSDDDDESDEEEEQSMEIKDESKMNFVI